MATEGDISDTDAVSAGAEQAENEICEENTEVSPSSFEEEIQKCAFARPFWEHLKGRGCAVQIEQYKVIYDAYMGGDFSRLAQYIMTLEDGAPLSKGLKKEIKKHGLDFINARNFFVLAIVVEQAKEGLQRENKELEQKTEGLQQKNKELQYEIEWLQQKIKGLQQKDKELEKEMEWFLQKTEELQQENKELRQRIKGLQLESEELRKQGKERRTGATLSCSGAEQSDRKCVSFHLGTEKQRQILESKPQPPEQQAPAQLQPPLSEEPEEGLRADFRISHEDFKNFMTHSTQRIGELEKYVLQLSTNMDRVLANLSSHNTSSEEERIEHKQLRPVVRTSFSLDKDTGRKKDVVVKEISYTPLELAQIKKQYSRLPSETEIEYVMRVSLTGGDEIILSEQEARGFWGPGIILTTGDKGHPWSLTQRAAFCVSSSDPLSRGEPRALVGGYSKLLDNVHKAAVLQMIHEQDLIPDQESPMNLRVKPERMKVLIRGLPLSFREAAMQIMYKIENGDRRGFTWADLAKELIDYGKEWGNVSGNYGKEYGDVSDSEDVPKPFAARQKTRPSYADVVARPPRDPPKQRGKSRGDWTVVDRSKNNRKPNSTRKSQYPERKSASSRGDGKGPYAELKEEARRLGIPPRLLSRDYSYQHLKDLVESWSEKPSSRSNSRERSREKPNKSGN